MSVTLVIRFVFLLYIVRFVADVDDPMMKVCKRNVGIMSFVLHW